MSAWSRLRQIVSPNADSSPSPLGLSDATPVRVPVPARTPAPSTPAPITPVAFTPAASTPTPARVEIQPVEIPPVDVQPVEVQPLLDFTAVIPEEVATPEPASVPSADPSMLVQPFLPGLMNATDEETPVETDTKRDAVAVIEAKVEAPVVAAIETTVEPEAPVVDLAIEPAGQVTEVAPQIEQPVTPAPRVQTPRVSRRALQINVGEQLRAEFANAIKQVDREATREERTAGLLTLLGQLAGDPEGRLRRPPVAARRAMAACNKEGVSTSILVTLLEGDPLLAKAVLARANSAYYSRSAKPCLVLAEAITRQGRTSVHNVLLEQSLSGLIYSAGGPWTGMINQVWAHMVRTAPIARALAPLFEVEPEQAFALGLLHDVGKLAVFDRIATLRTAHRGELHISKSALSRLLRTLHEPLGGLCALGWHFGDEAALAISHHHRQPVPAESDPLSEVIWLAERVDLAAQRKQPLDIPTLWREGDLSADPVAADEVIHACWSESASPESVAVR